MKKLVTTALALTSAAVFGFNANAQDSLATKKNAPFVNSMKELFQHTDLQHNPIMSIDINYTGQEDGLYDEQFEIFGGKRNPNKEENLQNAEYIISGHNLKSKQDDALKLEDLARFFIMYAKSSYTIDKDDKGNFHVAEYWIDKNEHAQSHEFFTSKNVQTCLKKVSKAYTSGTSYQYK